MNSVLLKKIGLSDAEISIYTSLLTLGVTPSGPIVRHTGMRKSTVYDALGRLQRKGLVAYVIKGDARQFQAADPDKLVDLIKDQRRELDGLERDARAFIDLLKKDFDTPKPHAEAQVFEGIEGFKTVRRDVLRHARGEHLLIGAISRENEIIPGFFEEWNRERQRKNIKIRILHKESARKKAMADAQYMGKSFQTRFLPKEVDSPVIINIYGDRVVNVLWKGRKPLCFLLINKDIADAYRNYFHYLWAISSK